MQELRIQVDSLIDYDISTNPLFTVERECSEYAVQGGKRIRSSIALLILQYFGANRQSYYSALVPEYLHTCSLAIDDLPIMDNDSIRRNRSSLHCKYSPQVAQLIAYNLNLAAQQHLVASSNRSTYKSLQSLITSKLSIAKGGICYGQLQDTCYAVHTTDQYFNMIECKTGSLFSIAFIIGYAIGKGSTSKTRAADIAGTTLGSMYQLYDDTHDYEEDRSKGRPNVYNYLSKYEVQCAFAEYKKQYLQALACLGLQSVYCKCSNEYPLLDIVDCISI